MVNVAPDLHQPVKTVRRYTMRAYAGAAIEAANVLLVLLRVLVMRTRHEELF